MPREKKPPKVLWMCRMAGGSAVLDRTPRGRLICVATARADSCARQCDRRSHCEGPVCYERKDR